MSDFRYSPQMVMRFRETLSEDYKRGKPSPGPWVLVEEYMDATARDLELRDTRAAQIRAYSPDVEFYGDESYREGNGIHVWTQELQDDYVKRNPKGADHFEVGVVYDCDSDLALKCIQMTHVLSFYNFGHGRVQYIGLVEWDADRKEWGAGFGGSGRYRKEQWSIANHGDFTT